MPSGSGPCAADAASRISARVLGVSAPTYAHVPLVLGPDGARLAKRHGDVTLREVPADAARAWMLRSLDLPEDISPAAFNPTQIPRDATIWPG